MSDEDRDASDDVGTTGSEFILYAAPRGDVSVRVLVQDETVWLPQKQIAELFAVGVPAISKHLKNIFDSGELSPEATVSKMETVAREGDREVTRHVDFYNLDAIIAVGYRVNSFEATQFRIWATRTLREYIVKGFVLDDERLKRGTAAFGKDYFDELLERIREIRASERRFYQKVTDLYALSVDYDKDAPLARDFFATVQNKLRSSKIARSGSASRPRPGSSPVALPRFPQLSAPKGPSVRRAPASRRPGALLIFRASAVNEPSTDALTHRRTSTGRPRPTHDPSARLAPTRSPSSPSPRLPARSRGGAGPVRPTPIHRFGRPLREVHHG